MAAATANRDTAVGRVYTGKSNITYGLKASAHLYRMTLSMVDGGDLGYCVDYTAYDANYRFVGVNMMEVHNLATAANHIKGDKEVVASEGTITLVFGDGDATDADLGLAVYAIDNQTVQRTRTNAIYVGRIMRVVSATEVEVEIDVDQHSHIDIDT